MYSFQSFTTSGRICTRAIARKRPPLKELAILINFGFRPHFLIFAGSRPKVRAIVKITGMKTIFKMKIVFSS